MGSNAFGRKQNENGAAMKEISSQNNFEVLSSPEEQVLSVLEEGEILQPQNQTREEVKDIAEPDHGTPTYGHSPTYAEMAKKKKPMDNSGLSDEDPLERYSKKGHKSHKTVREEKSNVLRCKEFKPL